MTKSLLSSKRNEMASKFMNKIFNNDKVTP